MRYANLVGLIGILCAASLVTSSVTSCGGTGASTEEAAAECDRIRNDLPACIDDAAYDACVSCREECGRECNLLDATCPHQFTCD